MTMESVYEFTTYLIVLVGAALPILAKEAVLGTRFPRFGKLVRPWGRQPLPVLVLILIAEGVVLYQMETKSILPLIPLIVLGTILWLFIWFWTRHTDAQIQSRE